MAGSSLFSRRNLTGSDLQHCQFMQTKAELWLQQGKFKEAIEGLDQALRLQRRVFGEKNRDVLTRYKGISKELLQSLRMTHGSSEPSVLVSFLLQFEKVLLQFSQAQVAAELSELYLALGATYRLLTNCDLSKQFLLKALQIASMHADSGASKATICLGLCSTLSATKDSSEALKYGKLALRYAWEEMEAAPSNKEEKLSLIAVGYHNVGVQEERLSNHNRALDSYKKAVTVLEDHGTEKHMSLLADLRKSLVDAQVTSRMCPPKSKRSLPLLNKSANNSPQPSLRRRSVSKTRTPDPPKLSSLRAFCGLKERLEQISTSYITSADHSYQTSLASTPRRDIDSDDDLRELEARGLLDYTLESECKQRGKTRRMRGRKRKAAESREGVASTSANTPMGTGEVVVLCEETQIEMPSSLPASPLQMPQSAQLFPSLTHIMRIQALIRGFLSRLHFRLIQKYSARSGRLALRCGRQFNNGTLGLVSIHRTSSLLRVSISSGNSSLVSQLSIPSFCTVPLDKIAQCLEYDCDGRLIVDIEEKAAICIQKSVRRLLARLKVPSLRPSYRVVSRSGVKIGPHFVTASLLQDEHSKVVRLTGSVEAELPVPSCFFQLSLSALIDKLHIHASVTSFSPEILPTPVNPDFDSDQDTSLLSASLKDQFSTSIALPNLSTTDTVSPLFPNSEPSRDEELMFQLACQGVCDLGEGRKYAVMVYKSSQGVKVKAFPQVRGESIPDELILSKDDPRLPAKLDFLRLSQVLRLNGAGELALMEEGPPPAMPFTPRSFLEMDQIVRFATTIQSCFRVHKAKLQRRWMTLSPCKLLYRGCKQLSARTLDQVAVFAEEERLSIEAKDVQSAKIRRLLLGPKDYKELELSPDDGRSLFERLYSRNDLLMVAPTLSQQTKAANLIQKLIRGVLARYRYKDMLKKSKRKLQFFAQKVIDAEVFHLAIYEFPDKLQVERFKVFSHRQLKYHSQIASFPLSDLIRFYGKIPPAHIIFEDIFLTNNSITIRPRVRPDPESVFSGFSMIKWVKEANSALKGPEVRSIIRTSKKLGEVMRVITMSLGEGDMLEFAAFAGSNGEPLRVSAPLADLAQKTRLPESAVFPIGTITIQRLLKIEDGKLTIDFSAETPDLNKLATLMQAYVRGFLVRSRIVEKSPKSHLLACQVVKLNDCEWVLYAYRQPPWIDIKGYKRHCPGFTPIEDSISESIFRNFPPSISNKRVIENFVFPKYSLEGDGEEIHFRATKSIEAQSSLLNKHKEKFRVIAGSPGKLGRRNSRRPQTSRKDVSSSLTRSPIFSPATSIELPSSPNPSSAKATLVRRMLSKDNISLQITPPDPVRPHTRTSSIVPENPRKLVLKSGVEIEGKAYQASMFTEKSALLLQLVDSETGEALQRLVNAEKDVEQQCEQLLNRIHVVANGLGAREIEIQDCEVTEEILYRRSHYISSRFYHVTVYRTSVGVRIEALDPTTKEVLVLSVSISLSNPVQHQLSLLMNRIEVVSTHGVDSLSLND